MHRAEPQKTFEGRNAPAVASSCFKVSGRLPRICKWTRYGCEASCDLIGTELWINLHIKYDNGLLEHFGGRHRAVVKFVQEVGIRKKLTDITRRIILLN